MMAGHHGSGSGAMIIASERQEFGGHQPGRRGVGSVRRQS